jgi:hypothetical protein
MLCLVVFVVISLEFHARDYAVVLSFLNEAMVNFSQSSDNGSSQEVGVVVNTCPYPDMGIGSVNTQCADLI